MQNAEDNEFIASVRMMDGPVYNMRADIGAMYVKRRNIEQWFRDNNLEQDKDFTVLIIDSTQSKYSFIDKNMATMFKMQFG